MRSMLLASAAVALLAAGPAFAQTYNTTGTTSAGINQQTGAPNPSEATDAAPAAVVGGSSAPAANTYNTTGTTSAGINQQTGATSAMMNNSGAAPVSGNAGTAESMGTAAVPTTTTTTTSSLPPASPMPGSTGTSTSSTVGSSQSGGGMPYTGTSRFRTGTDNGTEPKSAAASNIVPSDTRSVIAPQLPTPAAGPDAGTRQYLMDAQRALQAGQSGRAQEALERAETRALDRSTAVDQASTPDQSGTVGQIRSALESLGRHDMAAAQQTVAQVLNEGQTTASTANPAAGSSETTGTVGAGATTKY